MISKVLLVIYVFYVSIFLPNNISTLLIFKKSIFKIIFNWVLAIRKIFRKT